MQEGHFSANAFSHCLSSSKCNCFSPFFFCLLFQSAGYALHLSSWLEYEKEVKVGFVDTWAVSCPSASCCFGTPLRQERQPKPASLASSLGKALLKNTWPGCDPYKTSGQVWSCSCGFPAVDYRLISEVGMNSGLKSSLQSYPNLQRWKDAFCFFSRH